MKITVKVGHNDRYNIGKYQDFEIVESLPTLHSVEEIAPEYNGEKTTVVDIQEYLIDCEQGNDRAFDYKYYRITKMFEILNEDNEWEFDDCLYDYLAIENLFN